MQWKKEDLPVSRRCPAGGSVAGSQHVRAACGQQRALRLTSAHTSSFCPLPPALSEASAPARVHTMALPSVPPDTPHPRP